MLRLRSALYCRLFTPILALPRQGGKELTDGLRPLACE